MKVSENKPFRGRMKDQKQSVYMYPSMRRTKRGNVPAKDRKIGKYRQVIHKTKTLTCGLTIRVKGGKMIYRLV